MPQPYSRKTNKDVFLEQDMSIDILDSRKAFVLQRYVSTDGFNHKGLERDTAALVLETSGEIHSFFLAVLPNGSVTNPAISKTQDVSTFYAKDSPQTLKERKAGLKIRQALIDEPAGTLVAWISPPGGEFDYEQGRFEIARVRELLGLKILQSYGISLKNVTPQYCQNLFWFLEEFSNKQSQNIISPEDLRDKISIFNSPDNSSWFTFLQQALPELSPIFEKIINGEVHRIKLKAIKDAKEITSRAISDKIVSKEDLVILGAQIERGMEEKGWNLESGVCGLLNGDLLKLRRQILQNRGMFGTVQLVKKATERNYEYHMDHCVICDPDEKHDMKLCGPCKICEDCEKKFDTDEL